MKSNENLQKDVQDAIKWEPLLHAAEIGVIAKDGIVTLTGTVDDYMKKVEAERATKKVEGVKAIVEKIDVDYGHVGKTDNEIAIEVVEALKRNVSVPDELIKIKVQDGWVYLEGNVKWHYQKRLAYNSVKNIIGVKDVINDIKIEAEVYDQIEKEAIEKAFECSWSINNDDIKVEVEGNEVTLSGIVDSYYVKEEAERIAWNAHGVTAVNNELIVGCFD